MSKTGMYRDMAAEQARREGRHMSIREFPDVEQGTEEWFAVRRGLVTASVVGQLLSIGSPDPLTVDCPACSADADSPCLSQSRKTPTPIKTIHDARAAATADLPTEIRVADTDTSRGLTALLVAERVSGFTDPTWQSADMMRGIFDEPMAREKYAEAKAPVRECGFMVRDDWGFPIGYSPDGLVGDDGLIEVKSRRQKKQLQTILADEVPAENMAQLQAGLLVSGRAWIDYVSYCGGMPMWVKRVLPEPRWFDAIETAVAAFERTAAEMVDTYVLASEGLPMTERLLSMEVVI